MMLFNGDCLDLIKTLDDNSVDCIICDPPYFIGMTHNGQKGVFGDLTIMKPFFESLFSEFKRVIKKDGCIYFFCDWRSYAFHYPIFDKILNVKNLLVWNKHGKPLPNDYGRGHEFIIFSGKTKESHSTNVINGIKSFNCFSKAEKNSNGEKVHPTQKPVELINKFILDSTEPGDTVLDCFMGSGTTGVSSIRNGRNFIGFELDEHYFEIAQKRISAEEINVKNI